MIFKLRKAQNKCRATFSDAPAGQGRNQHSPPLPTGHQPRQCSLQPAVPEGDLKIGLTYPTSSGLIVTDELRPSQLQMVHARATCKLDLRMCRRYREAARPPPVIDRVSIRRL